MASPPISRVRFWSSGAGFQSKPPEWSEGWIVLTELPPERWEDVAIQVQETSLQPSVRKIDGSSVPVAPWPRSGPGNYELRIKLGEKEQKTVWRIEPDPSRLTLDAYERLIEDLEVRQAPALALCLDDLGALSGLDPGDSFQPTLEEEIQRLRRAIEGTETRQGFANALHAISQDPHLEFKEVHPWKKRKDARRPRGAQLHLAMKPGNLDEKKMPETVKDTRNVNSVDVYENQLLFTFFRQLDVRTRALDRSLSGVQSEAATEARSQVQHLRGSLGAARRQAPFLDQVSLPKQAPRRATMVLQNRPPYRASLEAYLEFHKTPFIRLKEAALEAPLDNLPNLYQLWCTIWVITAFLQEGQAQGYQVEKESLRIWGEDEIGHFARILPDGEPAVRLHHPGRNRAATLTPERTFGRSSGEIRSVSFAQRPDIAVELSSGTERPQVLLFDPKYKLAASEDESLGNPTKADIDKMHAYRDAIRSSDGETLVEYAAILYPGATRQFTPSLAAVRAYPGEDGTLIEHLRKLFRSYL